MKVVAQLGVKYIGREVSDVGRLGFIRCQRTKVLISAARRNMLSSLDDVEFGSNGWEIRCCVSFM